MSKLIDWVTDKVKTVPSENFLKVNVKQLTVFPDEKELPKKKEKPYWVKMGLDQPLTQWNH